MAKEDPESSLAEDRAWDVWSNDDSSGEARQFFRLEDREDVWEHIFRQGFRAGREHGRQSPPVLGTYANHARRLTELEGLLPRIDALEQTVKANDEKRHFGEGELRGYNQELERAVARIESRLRPEILVTPLAKPLDPEEKLERHGLRDRGDGWHERLVIAPTPDYRIAEPTEAPEPCSCDESLALREEVRLLRAELGSASLELKQMAGRVEEAEQYAAACEKTAALNQKENVRLKTELVESKAVRKTLEQRVCSQRLVGAAMHKQLAAANALLVRAHLSDQPAAPACACGHPEDAGKHGASMCEIDGDEPHQCDWFGRFTCRICGKRREDAQPAPPEASDGAMVLHLQLTEAREERDAANALLGRAWDEIDASEIGLRSDIEAHLSAQPAAPSLGQPGADEALERIERLRAEASDA